MPVVHLRGWSSSKLDPTFSKEKVDGVGCTKTPVFYKNGLSKLDPVFQKKRWRGSGKLDPCLVERVEGIG